MTGTPLDRLNTLERGWPSALKVPVDHADLRALIDTTKRVVAWNQENGTCIVCRSWNGHDDGCPLVLLLSPTDEKDDE